MLKLNRQITIFSALSCASFMLFGFQQSVHAQSDAKTDTKADAKADTKATPSVTIPATPSKSLYKYVDKDGKVTYSDQPPKPGETAGIVNTDTTGTTVRVLSGNARANAKRVPDLKALAEGRQKKRDELAAGVSNAEAALEKAKKALEDGRDATPEETRIVVGKNSNSVQRTEAYTIRIEKLEAAVKAAQENLDKARNNALRGSPD